VGSREVLGSLAFAGVLRVSFSTDGARLATGGVDGTAIWSARDTRPATLFETWTHEPGARIEAAHCQPTGARLLVVDLQRGRPARLRVWHSESEHAVALAGEFSSTGPTQSRFSEDGLHVILDLDWAGMEGAWDAATGAELPVEAAIQLPSGAGFDSDARRMITASDDGTARIWETATCRPIDVLQHEAPVLCAAFDGDGTHAVTADSSGTVRRWALDRESFEDVLELARRAVPRDLSDAEKDTHAIARD
jgi:WD40 repeat protein